MSAATTRFWRVLPWVAVVLALVIPPVVRRVTAPRDDAAPAGAPTMAGMDMGTPPPGAGSSAVFISPAKQQLIGVRTGLVTRRHAGATVRTVGTLAYDETHVTQIHVKFPGWVEHLFVDYVGQRVRRGQALFDVYSPDVVTAESDYLVALASAKAATPGVRADSEALLRAARNRLATRWDLTDGEIAAIEARGKPSRTLTVFSPFDGVVLERNTFAGQYLMPQTSAFKIADLSTIWAVGQLFEYEAGDVAVGDRIEVEFPHDPSLHTLGAAVDFVHPDLDPGTRRLRFRATLPNPGALLKPDTYVTIVLHGPETDELVVPREAIIDTGDRKYALLALANGYFDPRDVKVGPPVGNFYPVLSGLAEGDRVVTSAQFLVDSETNLMSAMQGMAMTMPGMDMPAKPPAVPSSSATATPSMDMPGMKP